MRYDPSLNRFPRQEIPGFNKELPGLYEKAQQILQSKTPDMDRFAFDTNNPEYSHNAISHDKRVLHEREGAMAKDIEGRTPAEKERHNANVQLATIFEAILIEHAEASHWFGDNARTMKTTRFDDVMHGIDLAVEFSFKDSSAYHAGASVDATFSARESQKKIAGIISDLKKGRGGDCKYYRSPSDSSIQHLRNLPRVVMGIGKEIVEELSLLWKNESAQLAEHAIQRIIAQQAVMQLRLYIQVLEEYQSGSNKELLQAHKDILSIFEKIEEQMDIPLGRLSRDPVHQAILEASNVPV